MFATDYSVPMDQQDQAPVALCPNCNVVLSQSEVRTAIWQGDRLVAVEGISALVCPSCREQYYDDDVSEALRRLGESGFPADEAEKIINVPVFTLAGRIRTRKPLPEDTYVD